MKGRIRRRSAVLVAGGAVVLGGLAGSLLPDLRIVVAGSTPTSASSASTRATSPDPQPTSAGSATLSPTTGSGPAREHHLVPVAAFAEAGLSVAVYPQNGNTMPTSAVTECTDDREVGARTLADLTGRDPAVLGTWDEPVTTNTADEVIAVAESPERAAVYATRLTAAQTVCQDEPAGHFVYGDVHTEQVPAGSSARWLGRWSGGHNTTGRAPAGTAPCGGVVIASNGTHFAVLQVFMCADADGMATLARAAARQLG